MADTSSLEAKLRRHVVAVVEAAADEALAEMQADMPYKSGALHDSASHGPVQFQGDVVSCPMLVEADHAEFVNDGTQAHLIFATQPHGMLVFETSGGTTFVRGSGGQPAVVHHPGTAANPFFDRMQASWPERLQSALDSIVTT